MRKIELPKNSLRELPTDKRDFALGAVFPQVPLHEVPEGDFVVANPFSIKNQGETDFCSAYAIAAVSEDQEGTELLPEFQFFKTKELSGDPEEWGADLRVACKSAVKFGSLPFSGFEQIKGRSRAEILNKKYWPNSAEEVALVHKKETFFAVSGRYDTFDNIRVALWQHRAKKCTIVTGALWRQEWLDAPLGIIPKVYQDAGFGHAFKIFGQKMVGGELHLMAQLSQGDNVGDNGIFYFPREVVNKEIGRYGIFMFNDISRENAEKAIKNKGKMGFWSFIRKLFFEKNIII